MTKDRLSVIILTKNGGNLFPEVLNNLFACYGIEKAEVLVIDSGSVDRTIEYARLHPKIRLIEIPSFDFGHGKTRNLGARLATGEILLYLVQDATPATPNFLRDLIEPLID